MSKLKRTKPIDYLHIILCLLAILPAIILKIYRRDIWLVSERKFEAKDNGYWFYKYVCENQKNIDIVYSIDKESEDYKKVNSIGKTISYGTYRHWIYYLAASKVISSQKNGKPNAAVCYVIETKRMIREKFYFLQHGVIVSDSEWLYYLNTKFKLFVCGTYPEYNYVKEKFGYPDGHVTYTGLSRFDELHKAAVKNKRIVIMPSWREWIAEEGSNIKRIEGSKVFTETEYYLEWKNFLTNEKLNDFIEEKKLEVIFYPHSEMQKYIDSFHNINSSIIIGSDKEYHIQELLKSSELLITDYSSVFFDCVYMKKPILFYQFDYEKFRKYQYGEGYFKYKDNPFGESCRTSVELTEKLIDMYNNKFKISETYEQAHSEYFKYYDTKNSERIFKQIKGCA